MSKIAAPLLTAGETLAQWRADNSGAAFVALFLVPCEGGTQTRFQMAGPMDYRHLARFVCELCDHIHRVTGRKEFFAAHDALTDVASEADAETLRFHDGTPRRT